MLTIWFTYHYITVAVYICGVSYSYKGSLYYFLIHTHILNTFKVAHLHTHIHKNMYNKTKRLDLVPSNHLIRGLTSLSHRQLFMRTRMYSVPNFKKKCYGSVSVMLSSQSHQCDGCKVRNHFSCFSFFWDFGVHFVTPTTTHISTKKE